MIRDPTLFMRADQVEAAWQVLMPVLKEWATSRPRNFPNYAGGTWGPVAADLLIERDGHSWPLPTAAADLSGKFRQWNQLGKGKAGK
jgi:glucose-6-phosphate 1-dehydrogenase